jgi:hypothetical protein
VLALLQSELGELLRVCDVLPRHHRHVLKTAFLQCGTHGEHGKPMRVAVQIVSKRVRVGRCTGVVRSGGRQESVSAVRVSVLQVGESSACPRCTTTYMHAQATCTPLKRAKQASTYAASLSEDEFVRARAARDESVSGRVHVCESK